MAALRQHKNTGARCIVVSELHHGESSVLLQYLPQCSFQLPNYGKELQMATLNIGNIHPGIPREAVYAKRTQSIR